VRIQLEAEDGCTACGGAGVIAREERRGKTRVVRAAEPCPVCHGRGVVPARRSLEVSIPPGVVDGTRIRLKGQGGKGSRPDLNGDLFLSVRLKPDRVFSVSGRDLRCALPVWDYEAALGAEITVPTLDGRLSLKIPADSQTGRVMRRYDRRRTQADAGAGSAAPQPRGARPESGSDARIVVRWLNAANPLTRNPACAGECPRAGSPAR
jgi:molecular chaperone DnaJ